MPARPEDDDGPAFGSTRAALAFALNASHVEMPRPPMNRAMASRATPRRPSAIPKKRKKRKARGQVWITLGEDDSPEALLEREDELRSRRCAPPPGPKPLRGLDAAHQAGYVLAQFLRMEPHHRAVLGGLLIRAYEPCACRSPCCSGWRRNARWAEAVKETCLVLEKTGDVLREATGRRGLSTNPAMRLAFVEQFFTKNAMTVAAAAELGGVTTLTATRHRDWIFGYLEQSEGEAWSRADALMDAAGVVGSQA